LKLRELQRSGRIGRIEVNVDTKSGKTTGKIIIPSSLDKAETSIVGAALEIIQRIGPCNAKIKVEKIEDVRISKRKFVIERAKELLKNLMEGVLPDSQELADEVTSSVRIMEVQEYGKDRLAAGPTIDESDEIIVVEGRADVVNLLKHGFKNAIAMNGTHVPETIIDLSKKKVITAFVDGDRGGSLITKELLSLTDLDYVARAPDGKEVEEITKKEIHKAIRSRISGEQARGELEKNGEPIQSDRPPYAQKDIKKPLPIQRPKFMRPLQRFTKKWPSTDETSKFKEMLENLVGTRGAYILDQKLSILGKVPITELQTTINSLSSGVYAVIFDGIIERELVNVAEKVNVSYLIAMETRVPKNDTKISLLTINDL
jgi:DNA primase